MRAAARRKTTIVVVLVVALFVWVRFAHHPDPTPYPQPGVASVQPSTPIPTRDPEAFKDDARARAAVAAWQAPTVEARQTRLAPLVVPAYLAATATIDPAEVPQRSVQSVTAHEAPDGSAVVDVVLTDGPGVTVDVTSTGLVTDIAPT